ncbi:seryl-tRNA synthetase [Cutibacterium acnes JCM 18920]|nr:seryl-tRNA synthetase [Cutibacterium acnes JCM 18920]
MALAAFHSDEILDDAELPKRYVAFSPCYRREAGSYGKDTRGIFRVHWFDKVEMFVYCLPQEAEAWHEKLLSFEKDFITALQIPFQVLDVASGDLGLSAARKFDCYGWLQPRTAIVRSPRRRTALPSRPGACLFAIADLTALNPWPLSMAPYAR